MADESREGIAGEGGSFPVEGATDSVSTSEARVETSQESGRGRGLSGRRKGSPFRREPALEARSTLTAEERFLVLDAWNRSGLPAADFSRLVHLSAQTHLSWRRRFEEMGPEGLSDHPRAIPKGSCPGNRSPRASASGTPADSRRSRS